MKKSLLIIVLVGLFISTVFAGRYYDPEIGRFTQIDPKWEKYPSTSPYTYCLNNPLKYIDPDGKEITNPQGFVIENPNVLMYLVNLDNTICRLNDVNSSDFEIEITGGDRYKKDGKIFSKTTNKEEKRSSSTSPHLKERGARAVDLSIRTGNITNADIKKASNELGISSLNINDQYKDNHIHIGLPWGYGNPLKQLFINLFKPFHREQSENGNTGENYENQ